MAEVRAMPVPSAPRSHLAALLGTYVVVAWAIIALWMRLAGVTMESAISATQSSGAQFIHAMQSIAGGALSSFGHSGPLVTTFVLGVLMLDVAVAAGIVIIYTVVRPRLAAHVASAPEGS